MSLCLLAAALAVPLAADTVTLAWTHSVERVRWEETWRDTPAGLVLVEARVKGSAAGMEPPPGARLSGGVFSFTPDLPPLREVVLRRSGATADWELCLAGACRPMSALLPPEADPVALARCPGG